VLHRTPEFAAGVPVEDRIRRAPTLIIVNEQGEEIGSGKGNSHSLWVLSRRLVRMLLKQEGPIALTAAAAVLVGPGGVSDPSKHRSQTQVGLLPFCAAGDCLTVDLCDVPVGLCLTAQFSAPGTMH
jgi:hypothetical protein